MNLESALTNFLTTGDQPASVEARIVSVQPLLISDCPPYTFELTSLFASIAPYISEEKSYNLILSSPMFEFKSVPNSSDFFLDLEAQSFKYQIS